MYADLNLQYVRPAYGAAAGDSKLAKDLLETAQRLGYYAVAWNYETEAPLRPKDACANFHIDLPVLTAEEREGDLVSSLQAFSFQKLSKAKRRQAAAEKKGATSSSSSSSRARGAMLKEGLSSEEDEEEEEEEEEENGLEEEKEESSKHATKVAAASAPSQQASLGGRPGSKPSKGGRARGHHGGQDLPAAEIPAATPPQQLQRITVAVESMRNASDIYLGSPILAGYDVVAVKPGDAEVLLHCISSGAVDLLQLELCAGKLPFPITKEHIAGLQEAGIPLELDYSPAVRESAGRRNFICNTLQLLRSFQALKQPGGLLLSSSAANWLELRGPADVCAVASLAGLHRKMALQALSRGPAAVLAHAERRLAAVAGGAGVSAAGGAVAGAVGGSIALGKSGTSSSSRRKGMAKPSFAFLHSVEGLMAAAAAGESPSAAKGSAAGTGGAAGPWLASADARGSARMLQRAVEALAEVKQLRQAAAITAGGSSKEASSSTAKTLAAAAAPKQLPATAAATVVKATAAAGAAEKVKKTAGGGSDEGGFLALAPPPESTLDIVRAAKAGGKLGGISKQKQKGSGKQEGAAVRGAGGSGAAGGGAVASFGQFYTGEASDSDSSSGSDGEGGSGPTFSFGGAARRGMRLEEGEEEEDSGELVVPAGISNAFKKKEGKATAAAASSYAAVSTAAGGGEGGKWTGWDLLKGRKK